MKRPLICIWLVLAVYFPAFERAFASDDTPRWEANERRLALDAMKDRTSKEKNLFHKESREKCDSEYEACLDKARKIRKACASEDEACIHEFRRQNALCLAASENCENSVIGGK